MKTINYFFCICIFSVFHLSGTCFSQAPTYNLTAKNFCIGSINIAGDALFFDVYIEWTNSGVAPNFEFAGSQLYFSFNRNVLSIPPGVWPPTGGAANPDTSHFSFKIVGSDLPTAMQPRNNSLYTASSPTADIMRAAINTFPGAGFGINIPEGFPGLKIAKFRLWNKNGTFNTQQLNIAWRNPPVVAFTTKLFAYIGTTNTDITTSATHTVDFNNDPLPFITTCQPPPAPNANFVSDTTIVQLGGIVNFFDLSDNIPTSWNWQFSGGTPSSSSVKNPVNIQYNSIGVYSVSLRVSNAAGSDSITRNNYITVLPTLCTPTWKNTVKIHDAGNVSDSLIFGTSFSGTNGIDTCLGERIIPPPPPTGVFDCRFSLQPNSTDESKIDFRKDTVVNYYWLMKFQPSSSGYPMTFDWNPSDLPSSGFFYLKDIITGTIVNINMKNQSSYVLTNPGITSLQIEYLSKFTQSIPVSLGWNILSVPLLSENMNAAFLFPDAASPAYYYNNGYVTVDSLKNSKGYWMKFSAGGNYSNTGIQYKPPLINVITGWNLIGPFDINIPVNNIVTNPSGILISEFFGYNAGYIIADTLKSGKGYWIKSSSNGTMMKDTNDISPYALFSDSLNQWTRFEITDNNDNTAKLYLANQNQITLNYDLPPVPPSGIFDIRYGSDKFVESFGQNHVIKINSAIRPVRLKAFNLNGNKYRLKDGINGNVINSEITEGTEFVINDNIDNLILVEESLIPNTYSLNQNYPNPFNPVTVIKYQIPVSGQVKITLYDVLGKEVRSLVNMFQNAGVYEISVNGNNLSSGTYFYRLESNNFSDLKKMILLK